MKRQLTASRTGTGTSDPANDKRTERADKARAGKRTRTPFSATTRLRSTTIERDVALASVSAWTHTLELTGELTHRTAHELEVEIEQLCAEGVTGIKLDLRRLSFIDAVGVTVIAFRSELCRRRGFGFALIADSPMIRRAFAQAGVEGMLSSDGEAADEAVRVRPLKLTRTVRERSLREEV